MPRPATAADAPLLAAIHAAAFPPGERWDEAALGTLLALPGAFAVLLGEDGFALARAAAGEAEVLTLAVRPERRRLGLGAALLAGTVAGAAARGAEALFLEVSERNGAARALYAGAGFAEVGRRRRYYADGADALVLRLQPAPAG